MTTHASRGFVHLHTHSDYSAVDGLATLPRLVDAAAADGNPALAITDHGSLGSVWRLHTLARKAGIKPIAGLEAYVAMGGDRHGPQPLLVEADSYTGDADEADKPERGALGEKRTKRKYYEHLTLLAASEQGWRNLVTIHNRSQDSRYRQYPLIDYNLIRDHSDGLIILTGCIGGGVAGSLARGDKATARRRLEDAIWALGGDTSRVFVEVMHHDIPEQLAVIDDLRALADEHGLSLVATNDAHFVVREQDEAHDAWLAVGTTSKLSDENRFSFHGHGHHLRTEEEMRALFDGADWWQEACDTTVRIADMVQDGILSKTHLRLPRFNVARNAPDFRPAQPIPADDEASMSAAYLRHLVSQGARERYGDDPGNPGHLPTAVNERLKWEFKVIRQLGVVDYFLIVWDVISWARSDRGKPTATHPTGEPGQKKPILVGPGRGSAAGSAVSFCLGIVGIDPIANGLLFERFLDPQRVGMPDIDVDFEKERRAEVIEYLTLRWGRERVAQIGTYGKARSREAINDAARVLSLTSVGDRLSSLVPLVGGATPATFAEMDERGPASVEFWKAVDKARDDAERILDLARSFEGVLKQPSVHPCGVLISDEPLLDLVPMRFNSKSKIKGIAPMVTEWEGPDVDAYGLLKLDVLGLRTLDIVSRAVGHVRERTGEEIDITALDADDRSPRSLAAFALIRQGRTQGLFQMESSGMSELVENAGPDCLDDLSAVMALYRPGPLAEGMHRHWADRKRGREKIDYSIFTTIEAEQQVIASVLDESMGIVVFQEQAMLLGEVLAGFGPAEKNRLRKAISKKIASEIEAVGTLWMEGAVRESVHADGSTKIPFREQTAQRVWDAIKGSARYAFNKSHSIVYGQLAFITAYLKASFPAEYAAAILASTTGAEKRLAAIHALEQEGVTLLPPDINLSQVATSPDGPDVRLGLSEVKGVRSHAAAIVTEREASGPYASLADVLVRTGAAAAAETESEDDDQDGDDDEGAGSGTKPLQAGAVVSLIEAGAMDRFGPRLGQVMVARAVASHPDMPVPDAEWGLLERAVRERARIEVILSEHPLQRFVEQLRTYRTPSGRPCRPVHTVAHAQARERVLLVGLLAGWKERTYRGGRMVNIAIEGTRKVVSGVMWDRERASLPFTPSVGSVVAVQGTVRVRLVEIEGEDGTTEQEERRELTFQDMWEVSVDDPAADPVMPDPGPLDAPGLVRSPEVPVVTIGEGSIDTHLGSLDGPVAVQIRHARTAGALRDVPAVGTYALAVHGEPLVLTIAADGAPPPEETRQAATHARRLADRDRAGVACLAVMEHAAPPEMAPACA